MENSETIYIIMKSLSVNGEDYYGDQPSTWCDSPEDATAVLEGTLKRWSEWYSDIVVLGQDDTHLHVRYTSGGAVEEICCWVRPIRRFKSFAW